MPLFFLVHVFLNVSNKPTYSSKLRVQTKCYEHEEEQDGPQWRYRKFGQGIRVSNENQSKPLKWAGEQAYSHFVVKLISLSVILKSEYHLTWFQKTCSTHPSTILKVIVIHPDFMSTLEVNN